MPAGSEEARRSNRMLLISFIDFVILITFPQTQKTQFIEEPG